MKRLKKLWLAALLALLGSSPAVAQGAGSGGLTVFAAASLTDAFRELGPMLPGGKPVQFNFAGSQQLAVQIEQGARADVFASADQRWMEYVQEKKLTDGEPRLFAHNRLVVIVPEVESGTHPPAAGSGEARHQARGRRRGGAGRQVLARGDRESLRARRLSRGYAESVLGNVVSQEENVKAVVAKVQLGEADAGFVYRSDVSAPVARYVEVLELPDDANVPRAIRSSWCPARQTPRRTAFVDLVTGPEGRRVPAKHGLMPASTTP